MKKTTEFKERWRSTIGAVDDMLLSLVLLLLTTLFLLLFPCDRGKETQQTVIVSLLPAGLKQRRRLADPGGKNAIVLTEKWTFYEKKKGKNKDNIYRKTWKKI